MFLSESVGRLEYPGLKKEAYIMLGQLDSNLDGALTSFDKAKKHALSDSEIAYITILKAKRLTLEGKKEDALDILDGIDIEDSIYQELFEEVYGAALTLN